jgi:LPS export ABC transporter protein LptC
MIPACHNRLQLNSFRIFHLVTLILLIQFSCKNDIETINALTSDLNLPDQSAFNFETTYTDSGLMVGKIIAPEMNHYNNKEEPYFEFPAGMKVIFYDESGNSESTIEANYAIYHENTDIWDARGQVIADNPRKGEKLETEQMFWNQREERIYTDKFTKLTNSDGVFYGENGFESRQDLTKWRLIGSKGTVNFREDQDPAPLIREQ